MRGVLLAAAGLTIAAPAWAAAGDAHAKFGPALFALGALVLAAKLGGVLAERWRQPPVLGELLIGIAVGNLLGPLIGEGGTQLVRSSPALLFLAEVGVLILLFDVGLEADLRALLRVGPSAMLVAMIGVVIPIVLGWAAAARMFPSSTTAAHLFIGATLSATSVGITARVLKDLGATQGREGQVILGAALVDDILGLVVLAVVVGMASDGAAGPSEALWLTAVRITACAMLFLAVTAGFGPFLSPRLLRLVARSGHPEIMLVLGLAVCFAMAFAAELLGLAGIVGAFAAGLMLDPYGQGVRARPEDKPLAELLHPLSTLFVPLFFVLMGAKVDLTSLTHPSAFTFGAVLIACAVVGKLACAAGVVGRGMSRLTVAVGMIPRGEVGLIFASVGLRLRSGGEPVLSGAQFSAVVLMVLVTTLIAPIALRWLFARRRGHTQ
jgi:Kef-type K+ transport system membrane component KefB